MDENIEIVRLQSDASKRAPAARLGNGLSCGEFRALPFKGKP